MDPIDVLPSGGRLIHLGPPKTGTTAIQAALHASREALAEHDVHVLPAGRPRDWQAGLALFGGTRPGSGYTPDITWWERFAGEAAATPGTQVISNEAFAKADADGVARLVHDLGGKKTRYLYVVRRLDKLLRSHWQESVKGGNRREDLESWTGAVFADPESPVGANFWRPNDITAVLDRFLAHVEPETVTLLVADESDHDQLPRFFEGLLGVPPGTLQAPQDGRANRSLSLNEAEVIRRLNVLAAERSWSDEDRRFLVQQGLVNQLRGSARGAGEVPLQLPRSRQSAIEEQTTRRVAAVEALAGRGVRVVGDLGTLTPGATDYADSPPDGDDLTVSLPVVVDLVAATVEAARRREHAEPQLKRQLRAPGTAGRKDAVRALAKRVLRRR